MGFISRLETIARLSQDLILVPGRLVPVLSRCPPPTPIFKGKTLNHLLAPAMIAVTLAASAADAFAGDEAGDGHGGLACRGIIGGAIITGTIVASRPTDYVVYQLPAGLRAWLLLGVPADL